MERFHRFIDRVLTDDDVAYGVTIACYVVAFLIVIAALIVTTR